MYTNREREREREREIATKGCSKRDPIKEQKRPSKCQKRPTIKRDRHEGMLPCAERRYIHVYIHTSINTYIHACIHTYIHIHADVYYFINASAERCRARGFWRQEYSRGARAERRRERGRRSYSLDNLGYVIQCLLEVVPPHADDVGVVHHDRLVRCEHLAHHWRCDGSCDSPFVLRSCAQWGGRAGGVLGSDVCMDPYMRRAAMPAGWGGGRGWCARGLQRICAPLAAD
jgi:hypothetical protein